MLYVNDGRPNDLSEQLQHNYYSNLFPASASTHSQVRPGPETMSKVQYQKMRRQVAKAANMGMRVEYRQVPEQALLQTEQESLSSLLFDA